MLEISLKIIILISEQHKKNMRKYKEELKQKTNEPALSERKAVSTDLWSRLDELERLEAEKGELKRYSLVVCKYL